MVNDTIWFFSGIFLISFGILHEIVLYWLQLNKQWYSQTFKQYGFVVHAVQLGGVWICIGASLVVLFLKMPLYPFHQTVLLKILGNLIFVLGIGFMLCSTWQLGWKRVMKIRLFVKNEPSWVREGIFHYLENPMYVGSQLAMLGLAFVLDSWFLLIYFCNMVILQKILATMENRCPPSY